MLICGFLFLVMFVKPSVRIGIFVLIFCTGLLSCEQKQTETSGFVELESPKQNRTSRYTVYDSPTHGNCVENDIYVARRKLARKSLRKLEEGLIEKRIKLNKLKIRQHIPETPSKQDAEAFQSYVNALEGVPAEVRAQINDIELEIVKLSWELDMAMTDAYKGTHDLLYRQRCTEF